MEAPNEAEKLATPSLIPSFCVCASMFNGIEPALVLDVKANVNVGNAF